MILHKISFVGVDFKQIRVSFEVSNTRNVVCFILGNFPASKFYMPTFRKALSVPSS
jgi:hypothetical protein